MDLTPEQLDAADRQRLTKLSSQSKAEGVALIEIVYDTHVVRFDISALQAEFLTLEQLVDRCFRKAFEAVHLKTLAHESPSLVGAATDGGV